MYNCLFIYICVYIYNKQLHLSYMYIDTPTTQYTLNPSSAEKLQVSDSFSSPTRKNKQKHPSYTQSFRKDRGVKEMAVLVIPQ